MTVQLMSPPFAAITHATAFGDSADSISAEPKSPPDVPDVVELQSGETAQEDTTPQDDSGETFIQSVTHLITKLVVHLTKPILNPVIQFLAKSESGQKLLRSIAEWLEKTLNLPEDNILDQAFQADTTETPPPEKSAPKDIPSN